MKTSLKQNDFDRPTLKKGIEQTKSINRRKISRAISLDRSPTVLRGARFKYLSGEVHLPTQIRDYIALTILLSQDLLQ